LMSIAQDDFFCDCSHMIAVFSKLNILNSRLIRMEFLWQKL
jgi:hypothetical protein